MMSLAGGVLFLMLGAEARASVPVFAMPTVCLEQPPEGEARGASAEVCSDESGSRPAGVQVQEGGRVVLCLAGKHSSGLSVVGPAPGAFRVLPRVPVADGPALAALAASIRRSGILTRREDLVGSFEPSEVTVEEAPREAYGFGGLPGDLVFARHRARLPSGSWDFGPPVVVERGKPTSPFTVCAAEPIAFALGGRFFVFGGSLCCECGAVLDEVYGVTNGRLRRVFRTAALSD
jgi:hypothetical protein